MYNKSVADRILLLRKMMRDSQSAFANRIGTTQAAISMWERGRAMPMTEMIMTICEEYNVSADWLLGLAPLDAMRPVGWNREAENDRA